MARCLQVRMSSRSRTGAEPAPLLRQPEFIRLQHLLADIVVSRRPVEETEMYLANDLANALNKRGFSDVEIREAFAHAMRSGRLSI